MDTEEKAPVNTCANPAKSQYTLSGTERLLWLDMMLSDHTCNPIMAA